MDKDLFRIWRIDPHAMHYFGILKFLDIPGFFPQLACTGEELGTGEMPTEVELRLKETALRNIVSR